MKEQLQNRLAELRSEYESGRKTLSDLQGRVSELQNILLRISGAIQVLEEELEKHDSENHAEILNMTSEIRD